MEVFSRAFVAVLAALIVAAPAFADDPRRDEQWGLEMVKAPAAWPTSTGVGAVVAVIDTGVQPDHPDLGGRLTGGHDFVGSDPNPNDGDGHGTHVTGIIAANRDNRIGVTGVAPGAQVMPIRVLDDRGEGFADDVIKGIDYALQHNAHVINLSLGDFLPLQSALLADPGYEAALKRAIEKGAVVVLAAGNNSQPRCENPPVDAVLCVGAVDPGGNRSVFSSFGEGVDVMAPGGTGDPLLGGSSRDVLSTWKNSGYASVAGTSQAAPHVSGVAALLVSLGLSGADVTSRIASTSAELGTLRLVNAEAAVAGLAPPPPPTPGDPNPPPAATGSFSTSKSVRARTVRRRGFRVACKAARPGTCKVTVRYRARRIAGGRADVPAGIATTVVARLNRRGKRQLSSLRRRIRVKLTVTLPGEAARTRRVTVRR